MSRSAGKGRGSKRRSEAVSRRAAAAGVAGLIMGHQVKLWTHRVERRLARLEAEVLGAQQIVPAAPPRARVAHVTAHAAYVLGSRAAAVRWLASPNGALQGKVPLALMASDAGASEVLAVLDQILYGVYS